MKVAGEVWGDFHLDENRVTVTGDNKARLYFAQCKRLLEALHQTVQRNASTTSAEGRAVDHFVGRLLRTFEAPAPV